MFKKFKKSQVFLFDELHESVQIFEPGFRSFFLQKVLPCWFRVYSVLLHLPPFRLRQLNDFLLLQAQELSSLLQADWHISLLNQPDHFFPQALHEFRRQREVLVLAKQLEGMLVLLDSELLGDGHGHFDLLRVFDMFRKPFEEKLSFRELLSDHQAEDVINVVGLPKRSI